MKKTMIAAGIALSILAGSANAQTETTPKEPVTAQAAATSTGDRWNTWTPDKYKMLPMPAPLTIEKIFPVIGQYTVASADAPATEASSAGLNLTITLDESTKGIAWIEGLPQGKLKAYLQKSPATYMIPAQKTADNKDLAGGVLIFDKESNKLDVCIGCKFNSADPAAAFTATEPAQEEPVAVKPVKGRKGVKTAKAKPVARSTWKYSGSKIVEATTAVTSN